MRQRRRDYLQLLTVDEVIQKIGAAVGRWLDPYSPFLNEATRAIPAFTGYPPEAVQKGLAGFLGSLRAENLRRLVRDELGDPEILDGFRPRVAAPGLTRAIGPELIFHSFAGNVPGLAAQSLVMATLVKAASLGKVAAGEPIFASLFARSLAAVDPRLGDCLAVAYWPGDDPLAGQAAFAAADAVVAYGNEATIESVRSRVRPGSRLIAYSHKLSFGVVLRERLETRDLDDLADRAAYDVARFDQQGCLSPHLLYVEEGGNVSAADFGRTLAASLQRWSAVVPRGKLTPSEKSRSTEVRRQHEFRAAIGAGAVFGDADTDWAVLFDSDP
ncbi:MAG TPA: acyl-CoA reductase, partial [Chloroflexota bacterium]|nr:acyl-CoA reductase [Chloroflexota bacterium]